MPVTCYCLCLSHATACACHTLLPLLLLLLLLPDPCSCYCHVPLLPQDTQLEWTNIHPFFRTIAAVFDGKVSHRG